MLALVIHSYNYSSYAVWCLGSIGIAFLLCRAFKGMPKIVASVLGYSLALVAAYGLGSSFRADLFVRHHLEFYIYFSDWIFDSWDYFYRTTKTVLLDLLPLYYAFRFLTTSGRDARRFAIIPILIACFTAFECLANESTRFNYPLRSVALPLTHLLVAGLFWFRGRKADAPNSKACNPALPATTVGSERKP